MKQINVAYLRVSRDEQSTQHQLNSIKEYCKRNNITIDKVIRDEGISAYSKDVTARKGFQEVLHLGHQGLINNLITYESSRISRNFIEGQTLVDELTKCNVVIHSVMDNGIINQNELDQLFNSFKFFMNMKESRKTSERIKSSKKLLREQGKYLGHPVLRGFKVIDGKEVIDEEAKEEVIQMFDDYINYGGGYTVNKYKLKHHQILMQKLRNEKYKKIIGEEKFNKVQQLIKSRTTARKGNITRGTNKTDVPYEGLLYHSCGKKLVIDRNRKSEPIFRCKKCKGDTNITIKKSFIGIPLMQNIDKQIMEILNSLDKEKLEEKYNSRCSKNKSIISYRIKELNNLSKNKEKALILANAKLERYIIENANDNMIESISNMIARVKDELDDIQVELEKKQIELNNINNEDEAHAELIDKILEIKDIYAKADNIKKRAILNILVKKVIVKDINDYDIYLNI